MRVEEDLGFRSFWNQLSLKENKNLCNIRDEL